MDVGTIELETVMRLTLYYKVSAKLNETKSEVSPTCKGAEITGQPKRENIERTSSRNGPKS